MQGDVNKVNILLYSCNVDSQDNLGSTPLYIACISGQVEVVLALLSVLLRTVITVDEGHIPVNNAAGCSDLVLIVIYLEQGLSALGSRVSVALTYMLHVAQTVLTNCSINAILQRACALQAVVSAQAGHSLSQNTAYTQ